MIKKIISIKNLGIFKDYHVADHLPEFKKYNLIYGWNASGKTTLSKLFGFLETGKNKTFPDLKYRIKVSNFSNDNVTEDIAYTEKIKIFSKEYIERNVQIEEGKAKAVVILGEENKQLTVEIKRDGEKLTSLQDELKKLKKDQERIEKERGQIFTSVAKTIGEAIAGKARRDYTKINAEGKFNEFFSKKEVTDEILDIKKREIYSDTCKQDIRDKLDEISEPSVMIDEESKTLCEAMDIILEKSRELCVQEIDVVSIKRLKDNSDISRWVEEGLSLHRKHKSENCEFCTQKVAKERLSELATYFNDASDKMKKEIDSTLVQLEEIDKIINNINLVDKARFYKEFQIPYEKAIDDFDTERSSILEGIKSLKTILSSKKEKVSDKVDIKNDISVSSFLSKMGKINNFVSQHNDKTTNFETKKKEAEVKLEKHYLAEICDNVKDKDNELQDIEAKMEKAKNGDENNIGIEQLEKKIENNKAEISSVHKGCKEINEKLNSFLGGGNEISFEVIENSGYLSLKRRNKDAKNLSEGEKTSVALVYFLVSLKEQGINLSDTIIYIDDPISSLDSNSISQAFAFIKKETDKAKQVFISTHNYHFFKKVRDWLDGKKDRKTGQNEKAEFFMIKNRVTNGYRTANIEPLDDLIKRYNSEYQYLFSVLKEKSESGEDIKVEAWYPLPNMARKFLETFFAFKIPSEKIFSSQLKRFLEKDKSIDESKKERIRNFIDEKSHASLHGMDSFDLDNFSECKEVVADIISLVKQADQDHFEELRKCVRRYCA